MIYNIQALRAFAALNVVLLHAITASNKYGFEPGWIFVLEGWGANGVDIFFVISGFIMVYIQDAKQKSPFGFAIGRVNRIAPVYWVLTLILVLLSFIIPSAFNESPQGFFKLVTSFFFVSQLTGNGMPTLYLGWTLEYEMLFYLIFALSLSLRRKVFQFLAVVISILLIAILTSVNPIIIEFIFGMILAKLVRYEKFKNLKLGAFVVGFIALFASVFIETTFSRVIIWGIPAALIVFAACNMPQTKSKLLQHAGNASYSTYLIQAFSVPFFYKVASKFPVSISADVLAVLCLAFTAVLGSIVYTLLERPLNTLIKIPTTIGGDTEKNR